MELTTNIDWVGFVDWGVRDFHSYDTFRGATYNSYLIRDKKTALIDGVKGHYVDYQLRRIAEKVELSKIDYVVCNHAEPDHSSGLPELMKHLPTTTLLCNAKCREVLSAYYDTTDWKIRIVSPEDKISLGHRTLTFVNTPMVHWPESMFTYVPEDEILFSMDAFGQHIATSERFDDQYDFATVMDEAKTYYANIVNPYSHQVQKTMEVAAGLPIRMIATSHGLIWRKNIATIVEAYKNWSAGKQMPKVLIIFDSMWDSTTKMAEAVFDGASRVVPPEGGVVDVQLLHVRKTSGTRIATEMLDAAAVALGTATLNMEMMPQLSGVLTYLRGLKFSKKTGFAFGSYGWAPAGLGHLDRWIDDNDWTKISDKIAAKYRPTPDLLEQCRETGRKLAQAIVSR